MGKAVVSSVVANGIGANGIAIAMKLVNTTSQPLVFKAAEPEIGSRLAKLFSDLAARVEVFTDAELPPMSVRLERPFSANGDDRIFGYVNETTFKSHFNSSVERLLAYFENEINWELGFHLIPGGAHVTKNGNFPERLSSMLIDLAALKRVTDPAEQRRSLALFRKNIAVVMAEVAAIEHIAEMIEDQIKDSPVE
jgi:hypothetical protein